MTPEERTLACAAVMRRIVELEAQAEGDDAT
jgi:hypothetical protein